MSHRGSLASPPAWRASSRLCSPTRFQSPGPGWDVPPPKHWHTGNQPVTPPIFKISKVAVGFPVSDFSLHRFADLTSSCRELDSWTQDLVLPAVVWLSGLFNPQSFLTGETNRQSFYCLLQTFFFFNFYCYIFVVIHHITKANFSLLSPPCCQVYNRAHNTVCLRRIVAFHFCFNTHNQGSPTSFCGLGSSL